MSPDPISIAIVVIILLFSLTIHEAAHAAAATACGDDTARLQGRLSLNPIVHIDPFGTIILPIILVTMTGMLFGWAKPVPFNPSKLNNIRRDPVLIAIAGPLSNVGIALCTAFVGRAVFTIAGSPDAVSEPMFQFLSLMILLNCFLFLFNLIPVPPLDGHHVLKYFLPEGGQRAMQQIGPFGIIIAIFLARPLIEVALPWIYTFIFLSFGID